MPDILQELSKKKSENQVIVTGNRANTNALAIVNGENSLKTLFYNDRVTFTQNQHVYWEMRLQQYGYLNSLENVTDVSPQFTDHTVTYQHDKNLTQWFINSDLGIEHGLKLTSPPVDLNQSKFSQILMFKFNVNGSVKFTQSGEDVSLTDDTGDSFGRSVSLSRGRLVVGAPGASGSGEVYLFDAFETGIDNWGQIKKIILTSPVASDRFGESVYIDAQTLVAGAPGEGSNTGAAYVFDADFGGTGTWGQVVRLTASTEEVNAEFGQAVSIYSNDLIVGAPFNIDDSNGSQTGAAYIFNRNEGGTNRPRSGRKCTTNYFHSTFLSKDFRRR